MESRDTIVKAATPLARSKGSESVHGAILGYVQKGENRKDAQHREDGEKGLFNMSARNKPRVRGVHTAVIGRSSNISPPSLRAGRPISRSNLE